MKGLAGKVALVTGGSSGIGLAAARELGRAGAKVALVGRGRERGEAAERALREEGVEALYVQADMGRSEDVKRMVEAVVGRWDRLDVAVNNAALGDMLLAPLTELPEEEFDRVLGVDLKGVWLCMKYEIPAMLKGGRGAIVNVSSINGLAGTPMGSAYTAAKHGMHGLSKTAAMEFGRQGIRVNVVCPGAHRTPMLEAMFEKITPGEPRKAEEQYYLPRIPMGRIGEPEECGKAIAWLLSEEASYVNGCVMTVDGGIMAGL
ncbi:NAD(P)-dependent dehydrogenase (short-subunit alcohol dehydrogenase family) [Archangium gephyra]|uniref:3-oxoacyl-[acyl-carrier protein] reductase n=1 Tax=Archangium gephyra TaxID=48 RepID=A0AAC8TBP6_9BACT|nr:glucose 1-dehydrogenase [Archangium gephyra]AKI98620.1 3-oxoacyl-[acyl-carrier protein] reductase [Archangium gephyra]REG30552.1 NAD(P)-dependent dehydrogenase (short-subunit alcohol dehydrogenase family) [Archangium gephyra]